MSILRGISSCASLMSYLEGITLWVGQMDILFTPPSKKESTFFFLYPSFQNLEIWKNLGLQVMDDWLIIGTSTLLVCLDL